MTVASPNPWVAVDAGSDAVAHARVLRSAHERGISDGAAPAEIRKLVAASWRRSLVAGVRPEAPGPPLRLEGDELQFARSRSPLGPAIDVILQTLGSLDREHIVAIGDADANLLWINGDPHVTERVREMRFQEGAAWAESTAGTNAVGTAAALDHAVQIFSAEHLIELVHPWTCSAAPIHDPSTGELIGVVDLTAALRTAHPHTLALAALAARAAEVTLRVHQLEQAGAFRERWEAAIAGRRSASLLLDPRGRVIASRGLDTPPTRIELGPEADDHVRSPDGRIWECQPLRGGAVILWLARRSAERSPRLSLRLLGHRPCARLGAARSAHGLRSLELLAVLAMHPEGMTAEQLALGLYGERGKAVTVRAQVHRLRAHLGEGVIETQPYRLRGAIDADWLEVRRLVGEGAPRSALAAYPGALLAASDAPAIREARGLLEESLRRSVLTTGDPELLAVWLAHPSGADDLAAARALVATLPAGDPRRAAATARVGMLARPHGDRQR